MNTMQKQTRPERRIGDYFEHVSETEQDMAVEVIIQCGDKKFSREQNSGDKIFMKQVYKQLLFEIAGVSARILRLPMQ